MINCNMMNAIVNEDKKVPDEIEPSKIIGIYDIVINLSADGIDDKKGWTFNKLCWVHF
ncbi:MAG: hypothetical protein AB7V56_14920 [Candidatus Nitrosocosmicus sp.]